MFYKHSGGDENDKSDKESEANEEYLYVFIILDFFSFGIVWSYFLLIFGAVYIKIV